MAFPTTSILDSFDRANEDPLGNGNWSSLFPYDSGHLKIVSNVAVGNTGGNAFNACYWSAASFGPDCEVYATVGTLVADGNDMALYLRCDSSNLTNFPGYLINLHKTAGGANDVIQVIRNNVGSTTQLGADITQEVSAGDSIGASMIGSTITVYYKSGAGSWTSLGTRTDTTYTGAGKLALEIENTTGTWNDFGGGTVVAEAVGFPIVSDVGSEPMMQMWDWEGIY